MKLCIRACLAISSRVNMTFNITYKANSQRLLPIPLSNRLDWSSSCTIWLRPLKISANYNSSYPDDFYFLSHFAQMQSALKAGNAASSHHVVTFVQLDHDDFTITPSINHHVQWLARCFQEPVHTSSRCISNETVPPPCSVLIPTSPLQRRFLPCSQSAWPYLVITCEFWGILRHRYLRQSNDKCIKSMAKSKRLRKVKLLDQMEKQQLSMQLCPLLTLD